MSSITAPVTSAEALGKVRAKYYPTAEGGLRLATVQAFDRPVFRRHGYVERVEDRPEHMFGESRDPAADRERATRRAKIACFDLIACNHDLDAFCTFTYSPDNVDRVSYEDVYKRLSIWCSNRVQRYGLKYVAVPEYHTENRAKYGDAIHFHALCNQSALDLVRATSPYTGKPLTREGKAVYNIPSWKYGFTTSILIGDSETDRDRVTKYIYKYMSKQNGQKIGGRYYLHGGDLNTPVYRIGDDPGEYIEDYDAVKYYRCDFVEGAGRYYEWNFI